MGDTINGERRNFVRGLTALFGGAAAATVAVACGSPETSEDDESIDESAAALSEDVVIPASAESYERTPARVPPIRYRNNVEARRRTTSPLIRPPY